MADEEFLARLRLDIAGLQSGLTQATSHLQRFESRTNRIFDQVAQDAVRGADRINSGIAQISLAQTADQFQNLAANAARFATIGQRAFGAVLSPTAEFDTRMREVNSLLGLSSDEYASFSEKVRTIARDLGDSATSAEVAGAAYDIASAGFTSAADNSKLLEATLGASTAGLVDAKTAANVLVTTLNAYGKGADEASRVSDILFQTVKLGVTNFGELSQNIGTVNAVASGAGVELEEIAASIATLTRNGVQADKAVTGLRGLINRLINPKAADALEQYGLKIDENTLRSQGLIKTLIQINQATGGSAAALQAVIPDARAFTVAMSLMRDEGVAVTNDLASVQNSLGSTAKAAEENAKSLENIAKSISSALSTAAIGLGQELTPQLSSLGQSIVGVINTFDDLEPATKKNIAITGAAVVAFATLAAGGLALAAGVAAVGSQLVIAAGAFTTMVGATSFGAAAALSAAAAFSVMINPITIVIGLMAGAKLAFVAYEQVTRNAEKSTRAFIQTQAEAQTFLRNNRDLVSQTAEELQKQGRSVEDVDKAIDALQQQLQQANAVGNKTKLLELRDQIIELRETRKELALLQKQAASTPTKEATVGPAAPVTPKADEDDKAQKKRIQNLLEEQRLSKDTTDKKVADLQRLLSTEKLSQESRLRIRKELHQLEEQQARDRRSAFQEQLANDLQAIKQSKAGDKEKIARLRQLLQLGQLEGNDRRRILGEIFQIEQRNDAERQRRIEETRKKRKAAAEERKRLAKEAAEAERDGLQSQALRTNQLLTEEIDRRIKKLEEEAEAGKNVQTTIAQAINDRLALQEEAIRLRAEQEKQSTKSAKVEAEIEKNSQLEIKAARQAAKDAIADQTKASQDRINKLKEEKKAVDEVAQADSDRQSQSDAQAIQPFKFDGRLAGIGNSNANFGQPGALKEVGGVFDKFNEGLKRATGQADQKTTPGQPTNFRLNSAAFANKFGTQEKGPLTEEQLDARLKAVTKFGQGNLDKATMEFLAQQQKSGISISKTAAITPEAKELAKKQQGTASTPTPAPKEQKQSLDVNISVTAPEGVKTDVAISNPVGVDAKLNDATRELRSLPIKSGLF